MAPFETLPARLTRRKQQIQQAVERMVKAGAIAADEAAVRSTPVNTGRARSNWIVNVDTPWPGTIPPYVPGRKLGLGETANAEAAIAQGRAAISGFNIRANRSVFIGNNLDYIRGLNDGTFSAQSFNMIEKGAQAAIVAIRGIRVFKG